MDLTEEVAGSESDVILKVLNMDSVLVKISWFMVDVEPREQHKELVFTSIIQKLQMDLIHSFKHFRKPQTG